MADAAIWWRTIPERFEIASSLRSSQ